MKALCFTNFKQVALWNGSWTSWTPILKCFFKYLRAKMISNSDKNTKMKILQNTCVFTVKMHFGDLNNVTIKLKIHHFLYVKSLTHKEANLTIHRTSKSVSQAGQKHVLDHPKTIPGRIVKTYIKKYAKNCQAKHFFPSEVIPPPP